MNSYIVYNGFVIEEQDCSLAYDLMSYEFVISETINVTSYFIESDINEFFVNVE